MFEFPPIFGMPTCTILDSKLYDILDFKIHSFCYAPKLHVMFRHSKTLCILNTKVFYNSGGKSSSFLPMPAADLLTLNP